MNRSITAEICCPEYSGAAILGSHVDRNGVHRLSQMGFARDVLPHSGKAGKWTYPINVRPIARTKVRRPARVFYTAVVSTFQMFSGRPAIPGPHVTRSC